MPLAEAQGEWLAAYLRGRYALPSPADLRADIRADQKAMHKRYVASKRHTIQVDFDDYLHDLDKERERRRRARRPRAATRCRSRTAPRTRRAPPAARGAVAA